MRHDVTIVLHIFSSFLFLLPFLHQTGALCTYFICSAVYFPPFVTVKSVFRKNQSKRKMEQNNVNRKQRTFQ